MVASISGSGIVTFLNILPHSSARSSLIKFFLNQKLFNGRPCCSSRYISKASVTSANAPDRNAPFMCVRCPNVFFLLQTNPVTNPFDKAALSAEREFAIESRRAFRAFPCDNQRRLVTDSLKIQLSCC